MTNDYACSCWYSGISKYYKTRLQTAQNKTIRFLLGEHPRFHIGGEQFVKVNMLPVRFRVDQLKLNHMYKIHTGTAPEYLRNSFSVNLSTHNTRNNAVSYVTPHVNSYGKNSFVYTASKAWNDLPTSVKNTTSLLSYKRAVKSLFFNQIMSAEADIYTYQ